MSKQALNQQIRERIDAFVEEISGLVHEAALESVLAALGGTSARAASVSGGAPSGRGRRSKKKASRKAKARRVGPAKGMRRKAKGRKVARRGAGRGAGGASPERVLSYLRSNPDQRLEEVARGLGVASSKLKGPVGELLEAGTITRAGRARGTRYSAA
jgi:hypothetical protein